jgi:hypothetical protein
MRPPPAGGGRITGAAPFGAIFLLNPPRRKVHAIIPAHLWLHSSAGSDQDTHAFSFETFLRASDLSLLIEIRSTQRDSSSRGM